MICPNCKSYQTSCKDSRLHTTYRRRRYLCMDCGASFSTKESWHDFKKIPIPQISDNYLEKYLETLYNTGNWSTKTLYDEAIKELTDQLRYAYPTPEYRVCAIAYLALLQLNLNKLKERLNES